MDAPTLPRTATLDESVQALRALAGDCWTLTTEPDGHRGWLGHVHVYPGGHSLGAERAYGTSPAGAVADAVRAWQSRSAEVGAASLV